MVGKTTESTGAFVRMNESTLIHYANELLWVVFLLSMPVVGIAAFIGITVSLLQALTQIQDQTLQFLLKLVGVTLPCS